MKKNHAYGWNFAPPSLAKLLKIMKLTSILLFVCGLMVHAGSYSQDVKVTLSLNGVKMTTFFKAIEKETKYRFTFCNDIIPTGKIVTVKAKETPLLQVMDAVMMQTKLKYRFDEASGVFIISEKKDPEEVIAVRTVTGTVTMEGGEPLVGVSVQVKGSTKTTTQIIMVHLHLKWMTMQKNWYFLLLVWLQEK